MFNSKFGTALRQLREQAGLTQAELATKLRFESSQPISNAERGETGLSVKHYSKLAKILGCTKEYLIDLHIRDYRDTLLKGR